MDRNRKSHHAFTLAIDMVAARTAISCRQFQHPFDAARLGRGDFNRETPFNRFMKGLHELLHAVAWSSAAWNSRDFGPEAALFSLMHNDFDLHYRSPQRIVARAP